MSTDGWAATRPTDARREAARRVREANYQLLMHTPGSDELRAAVVGLCKLSDALVAGHPAADHLARALLGQVTR